MAVHAHDPQQLGRYGTSWIEALHLGNESHLARAAAHAAENRGWDPATIDPVEARGCKARYLTGPLRRAGACAHEVANEPLAIGIRVQL